MDTVEHYLETISREHHVHLSPHDPIVLLLTMLRKFEADLLTAQTKLLNEYQEQAEAQWNKKEQVDTQRMERMLAYATKTSDTMLQSIPKIVLDTLRQDECKTMLLEHALNTVKEQLSVSFDVKIPHSLWLAGGLLALLNVLTVLCIVFW